MKCAGLSPAEAERYFRLGSLEPPKGVPVFKGLFSEGHLTHFRFSALRFYSLFRKYAANSRTPEHTTLFEKRNRR